METITFNCRFITPAFLGGADPKGTPELRAPSIKGALRFWWRAQSDIASLKDLRKKEFEIFGGVEGEQVIKAPFSVRVSHEEFQQARNLPDSRIGVRNKHFKINIFEYLAYGTYDYDREQKRNLLNRDFVESQQDFTVAFTFGSSESKDEVLNSFYLLSLFGGLGSKSRNGYGHFEILNSSADLFWKARLKRLKSGEKKSFTSFSQDLLCLETANAYDDPREALAAIGKAYKNAREYIERPHSYENRSYIASPIVEQKNQRSFLDRHAKPYFLTVVPEKEQYRGLILFLPYLFLEGAEDMMKELYNEKKRSRKPSDLPLFQLEEYLVKRSIKTHQKNYVESAGYFHEELIHDENQYSLNHVAL